MIAWLAKTAKQSRKPERGHFPLPRIEQNFYFVQFCIYRNQTAPLSFSLFAGRGLISYSQIDLHLICCAQRTANGFCDIVRRDQLQSRKISQFADPVCRYHALGKSKASHFRDPQRKLIDGAKFSR